MELTLTVPKISASAEKYQFVAIPYDEYKLFLKLRETFSASVHFTALRKKRIVKNEQELARGEYITFMHRLSPCYSGFGSYVHIARCHTGLEKECRKTCRHTLTFKKLRA